MVYKYDVCKINDLWMATLYLLVDLQDTEAWEWKDEATGESFQDLSFNIADQGWIEKISNNEIQE